MSNYWTPESAGGKAPPSVGGDGVMEMDFVHLFNEPLLIEC